MQNIKVKIKGILLKFQKIHHKECSSVLPGRGREHSVQSVENWNDVELLNSSTGI